MPATLTTLPVGSPVAPAASPPSQLATVAAAVPAPEVAVSADVEDACAFAAPRPAQSLNVTGVRHAERDRYANLTQSAGPSLHWVMSRGKKLTRAQKRVRRTRGKAQQDQLAQRELKAADKVGDLTCGYAAADEFGCICSQREEDAGFDVDVVDAVEQLWRRAAREGHAFTTALGDLHAELERHRAALRDLERRFDELRADAPHDHVEPADDEVERLRTAILGPGPASCLLQINAGL